MIPVHDRKYFSSSSLLLNGPRNKNGGLVRSVLVQNFLPLRGRQELQPQKPGVRILGGVYYTIGFGKPHRDRLENFVSQRVGNVLGLRAQNDVVIGPEEQGVFPRKHSGDHASIASRPYRFLRRQLAREIQRLLETPGGDKSDNVLRPDIDDKFSVVEFRLEKLLPGVGNLLGRDELAVEG